ncbi:MAG: hypothetical protein R3F20_20075, partial [Planctomycetota bacterium]
MRRALVLLLFLLATAAPAQTAPASSGPHLTVRCDDGLEGAAERLRAAYPALLARIEERLGIAYPRPLTVRLVRDHESFAAAVREFGGGEVAAHVAAIAFSFADVIV